MESILVKNTASLDNIRKAYLELAEQFDAGNHSARYEGLDSVKLNQIDYQSDSVVQAIQASLLAKEVITPIRLAKIKKRTGGFRNVYILTVRDRIKARAIYRVLEPLCENAYSKYLFSYRPKFASYFAAKSLARRYRRSYTNDYILTLDLKSYSDYIDHDILKKKLFAIGVDSDFYELMLPFIKVTLCQFGEMKTNDVGIPQGTPLTALFANLYLNDVDKAVGPRVEFYRRVGDDLIICDKNQDKVNQVFTTIKSMVLDLKLQLSTKKTHLVAQGSDFDFMGYTFSNGKVGLDASYENDLLINWRKQLSGVYGGRDLRLRRLRLMAYSTANNFSVQFTELFKQHPQVDDDVQIQKLSNQLYNYLTKYLLTKITPRNRRLAKELLTSIKFPSFYDYYLSFRRGKK